MVARSIPDMEVVITGSFGKEQKVTLRKLGHRVGKVVIIEAITAPVGMDPNPI